MGTVPEEPTHSVAPVLRRSNTQVCREHPRLVMAVCHCVEPRLVHNCRTSMSAWTRRRSPNPRTPLATRSWSSCPATPLPGLHPCHVYVAIRPAAVTRWSCLCEEVRASTDRIAYVGTQGRATGRASQGRRSDPSLHLAFRARLGRRPWGRRPSRSTAGWWVGVSCMQVTVLATPIRRCSARTSAVC